MAPVPLARSLVNRGASPDETMRAVAAFDDLAREIAAATGPGALQPLGHLGLLRVTGRDGLDLLGRLVTQRIDDLGIGEGREAVMVSPKGRLIGLLTIQRREDHIAILTSEGQATAVATTIERYTVADDVTVESLERSTEVIGLLGPLACFLFEASTGGDLGRRPVWSCTPGRIGGHAVSWIVVPAGRSPLTPSSRLALLVSRADALEVWDALAREVEAAGGCPIGRYAAEVFRILDGIPGAAREISERYNPLEVGLGEAVCFSKGCYVGQEVIARLRSRDKVRRCLVGVHVDERFAPLDGDAPPPPAPIGAIMDEEGELGHLTSLAGLPDHDGAIGLAVVARDRWRCGQPARLRLPSADVRLERVALPFASWPGTGRPSARADSRDGNQNPRGARR